MEKIFVNIKLENEVLRQLVIDDTEKRSKIDEVIKNINYVTSTTIVPEFFYSDFKQWLFNQIIKYHEKHSDCLTKEIIINRIKKKYKEKDEYENKIIVLEKIFGYDVKLQTFKNLFEELKNNYTYKCLYDMNLDLNNKIKKAYDDNVTENAQKVLLNIDEELRKLSFSHEKYQIIEEDVFQNLDSHIDLIKLKRDNPEKFKGIPSGFEKIDELTGGWYPGELIFILGRPGHGKSILLLNFGFHAYMQRCNVIYVTIEIDLEMQRSRFNSMLTNINFNQIKRPDLMSDETLTEYERKLRNESAKHENKFWIIDAPNNCTTQFLEGRIDAFERTTGQKCHLLIVDPIYLMKPTFTSKNDEKDPVGAISWGLKLLARKLKIPVLVASQFSRESAKKHEHGKGSSTTDAAFSDKLSQNADGMIGIINDMNGRAKLEFPKLRNAEAIKSLFFKTSFNVMKFEYDYDAMDD